MAASSDRQVIRFGVALALLAPGAAAASFACLAVQAIPLGIAIGTRYASFSTVDKAAEAREQQSRRPISAPVSQIARLADRWRAARVEARPALAACLQRHLLAQANGQAIMGARTPLDGFYRQWMLASLAISWLKARSGLEPLEGSKAIRRWFAASGRQMAAFNTAALAKGENNNHRYWSGVALIATGRASGDAGLVATGRRMRSAGLDAVAANGTLSAELKRRALAYHYHLFAATALAAGILLDPAAVPPAQQAGMRRLATMVASDAARPTIGTVATAAGIAQTPEDHSAMARVLQPFVTDPAAKAGLDRLVAGAPTVYQFLGGDLSWLLSAEAR